jgi:hypothetical protein
VYKLLDVNLVNCPYNSETDVTGYRFFSSILESLPGSAFSANQPVIIFIKVEGGDKSFSSVRL